MKKIKLSIKDYIISNGIRHIEPYSGFTMDDFLRLHTELGDKDDIWSTDYISIIPFTVKAYAKLYITYDIENSKYISDCIELNNSFIDEAYDDYLIAKISSNGAKYKNQVKDILEGERNQ